MRIKFEQYREYIKPVSCVTTFGIYFILLLQYSLYNPDLLPGGQLLLNGDFREGISYWRTFHWFGSYEIAEDIRYIGSSERTLQIAIPPSSHNPQTPDIPQRARTAGIFQFVVLEQPSSSSSDEFFDGGSPPSPSTFSPTEYILAASVKISSLPPGGAVRLVLRGQLAESGRRLSPLADTIDVTHVHTDPLTHGAAWQEMCVRMTSEEPLAYLSVYLLLSATDGASVSVRSISLVARALSPEADAGEDPAHVHPADASERKSMKNKHNDNNNNNNNVHHGGNNDQEIHDGVCLEGRAAAIDDEDYLVHPRFAQSRHTPGSAGDVTLATQLTPDRLDALSDMFKLWEGPMSVAVYVADLRDLMKLEELRRGSQGIIDYVDFHIVYSDVLTPKSNLNNNNNNNNNLNNNNNNNHIIQDIFDDSSSLGLYPINFLRNVAIKHVATKFVLMLDVDFMPSPNLRQILPPYLATALPNSGFVLPAFEVDGLKYLLQMPRSKAALLRLVASGAARQIHLQMAPESQRATNYERWGQTEHPYLASYENHYEPFFVMQTAECRFDPRFKGYGFDKAAQAYALSRRGFEFYVLPSAFIVHRDHGVPAWRGQMPLITTSIWSHVYEYIFEVERAVRPAADFRALWEQRFDWLDLSQWEDLQVWDHMKPPPDFFRWNAWKLALLFAGLVLLWKSTLEEFYSLMKARYIQRQLDKSV